jgi:hypothetical protein
MGTLTDDDLRHLLGEAGGSFAVPEDGAADVADAALDAEVVPLHRRRWVQLPAAAVVVTGALLGGMLLADTRDGTRGGFVGLSGGDLREQVGTDGYTAANAQSVDQSGAGTAAGTAGGSTGGGAALDTTTLTSGAAAPAAVAPGSADVALRAAPQKQAAAPAAAPVPDGARVVKTGAIALIVDDGKVTPTLTQLQGFASAVGGVVANAKTQESGPTPSGSVTLRVPVDDFEEVVAKVRGMGAEVRSATTSGQDVTAQYADLEAQLRTLTAARERFLEILSEARSIGDVLAVQQRVDDVTGKIDRLEGQRRVLAAQSDSATLEVTVTEEDDPVVAKAERPDDGLGKAFADAWDGFASGVEGLIRLSGRGILLLLCLAAAWVVLRLGWRASRRRLV